MDALVQWVEASGLSALVTRSPWVWAVGEMLHFMGMAVLFGCIGLMDLRLLGVWKRARVSAVSQLVAWGVAGFMVNALTGMLFFIGEPVQYVSNPAFKAKMLLIALAGCNVALFNLSGVAKRVAVLDEGTDTPVAAKVMAGTSLALWIGVVYLGRMLPYLGQSF
jgi:hypothetical protein